MPRHLPPQLDLGELCLQALYLAHTEIARKGEEGRALITSPRPQDLSTEADLSVAEVLRDFFAEKKVPAVIYDEELGRIELVASPKYLIAIDDIDGSIGYQRGIPLFCTGISIYNSASPRYKDFIVSGVMEHNMDQGHGRVWFAKQGLGTFGYQGKAVQTSGKEIPDKQTLVAIDGYLGAEDSERFADVRRATVVRDYGCSTFHFAGISSGMIDAAMSTQQKLDEVAIGYPLIKNAGGFMADLDGTPIDDMPVRPHEKMGIVAAATEPLAQALLAMVR